VNLLLDTHIFLWLNQEPEKINRQLLELCSDHQNHLFLSLVSLWEIQIKYQLGKLKLHRPILDLITEQQKSNQLQILPIRLEHILALSSLENHHHDPFDRLLIAQSQIEDMLLVTEDSKIKRYQNP